MSEEKKRAKENAWFLLATLYGVPEERVSVNDPNSQDEALRSKNRVAWNRYFGASLDEKTRAHLIERHGPEELKPLSTEELQEVEKAFVVRRGAKVNIALPPGDSLIDFSGVQFDIDFSDAQFDQEIDFSHFILKGANFSGATFSHKAYFKSATFFGCANFYRAVFVGRTDFAAAKFFNRADFGRATFSRKGNFAGVAFAASSHFVNTDMKSETSFEGATFKTEPPKFLGAKLHQGTVWRDITWPPAPKKKDEAQRFIDAYACLKLEMDRLKKHEDELDFFALELQSRLVLQESVLKGSGLPIQIYGLVSDYGRSYARPLYALFAVAVVGTLVLLLSDALAPWQSPGLSIANTFNVFGFRKDFFVAATIERLPAGLKVFSAVQTILGTILLFLVGLGIRNKFRMK